MTKKTGVLLTNTGTPDAPTPNAIRKYLREFLSDKRIVQIPRLLWWPILYGLILPIRPQKSVKQYLRIWTSSGSPMRFFMQTLQDKLSKKMEMPVAIGMNYGNPSIQEGLESLRIQQVEKIIVLPLYPQFSHTTTSSSFDRVKAAIRQWPHAPEMIFSSSYAHNQPYIQALANTILQTWAQQGSRSHLLISFHGIPQRYVRKGDPYQQQCELTANLLANAMKLTPDEWTLCYQSQFGYDKWLKPSTFDVLTQLPQRHIKHIDVVCPGFAIDCLETLEEMVIRGKEVFQAAGGELLRYIPALNDSHQQVDLLASIIHTKI